MSLFSFKIVYVIESVRIWYTVCGWLASPIYWGYSVLYQVEIGFSGELNKTTEKSSCWEAARMCTCESQDLLLMCS